MATITETVPQMETMHLKMQTKVIPQPPAGPKPAKAKLKLDPLRALEPARKKLSTVECQRIMAVLDDTIKKNQLVSMLPYIITNLERYKVSLGSDLVQALQDHKVVIESFEELKSETEKLLKKELEASGGGEEEEEDDDDEEEEEDDEEEDSRIEADQEEELDPSTETQVPPGEMEQKPSSAGSQQSERSQRQSRVSQRSSEGDDRAEEEMDSRPASAASVSSQVEAAMRNMALVAKQMQFSCKNILRAFSASPSSISGVLKDYGEPSVDEENQQLVFELRELRDILLHMLLTTPVEESERNQYLREISQRERHNAAIIQKLETDLNAALDDKENEIKKKNDVIRRLQADLRQIEKFSEEHIRRTKSEAEKQEAADMKNSEGKKQKLGQEVTTLTTQLSSLIAEHRESEQALRKKKFRIETEVENWIKKYDTDMGERQDQYEEIDAQYTEEKKQLNELEERFKTLEEEYSGIMEERRIAREKREAAERELQMSIGAATTIQAFWRSFKVRKALKSKKKKGGKKKK